VPIKLGRYKRRERRERIERRSGMTPALVVALVMALLLAKWIGYQKERKNLFVFFLFPSATIPSSELLLFGTCNYSLIIWCPGITHSNTIRPSNTIRVRAYLIPNP